MGGVPEADTGLGASEGAKQSAGYLAGRAVDSLWVQVQECMQGFYWVISQALRARVCFPPLSPLLCLSLGHTAHTVVHQFQ